MAKKKKVAAAPATKNKNTQNKNQTKKKNTQNNKKNTKKKNETKKQSTSNASAIKSKSGTPKIKSGKPKIKSGKPKIKGGTVKVRAKNKVSDKKRGGSAQPSPKRPAPVLQWSGKITALPHSAWLNRENIILTSSWAPYIDSNTYDYKHSYLMDKKSAVGAWITDNGTASITTSRRYAGHDPSLTIGGGGMTQVFNTNMGISVQLSEPYITRGQYLDLKSFQVSGYNFPSNTSVYLYVNSENIEMSDLVLTSMGAALGYGVRSVGAAATIARKNGGVFQVGCAWRDVKLLTAPLVLPNTETKYTILPQFMERSDTFTGDVEEQVTSVKAFTLPSSILGKPVTSWWLGNSAEKDMDITSDPAMSTNNTGIYRQIATNKTYQNNTSQTFVGYMNDLKVGLSTKGEVYLPLEWKDNTIPVRLIAKMYSTATKTYQYHYMTVYSYLTWR